MAITVRLSFDVEDETSDDTDAAALRIARLAEDAVASSLGDAVSMVGVSRAEEGPMRGSLTVEPVIGRSWRRVEHQEAV